MVALSYTDVITKFSWLDGLPILLINGASLARFARRRSTMMTIVTIIFCFVLFWFFFVFAITIPVPNYFLALLLSFFSALLLQPPLALHIFFLAGLKIWVLIMGKP